LAVTLAVVGVLAGGLVWLVPTLVGQAEALATGAIGLARRLPQILEQSPFLGRLEASGVVDRERLLGQLSAVVPQQAQALAGRVPALIGLVTKQVGALLGLVTTAALLPVLLFYMLKDFPRLRDGAVSLLPRVGGRREYLGEVGRVFGSYLRGQLAISAASAILVGVPLFLFGVPFSLLLGLAAGLLNLVPSIGSILTYVLGVVLMLAFGTTTDLLVVLGVLAAQAVVEQAILTPHIMSQQVDLHPVVILLALFVSGALFGLVGLLLAVPGAALVASAVRAHREAVVLDVAEDDGLAGTG
ncbi:MAG TPA: AI-2E family transporter, partial [Rubricoccaceae bacterium]